MRLNRIPSFVRRLALIVLVAALYAGTAALGFRLALPPGNVTAFWPPSGIALAAVLAFGWQMGLGVFAGSLLINGSSLAGPAALPVSAAIAAVSTLQTWVIAWLIRRWVKPFPPENARATLRALALPLALTCLAPLVGVTSLCAAGYSPWNNYTILFRVWWLGDAAGTLLFTPGLLVILYRVRRRDIRQAMLWPLTAFFIGVSLLGFMVVQNAEQIQLSKEVRHDLTETMHLLKAKFDQQVSGLEGITAAYTAYGGFDPTTFQAFTRPLIAGSPATTAAEWIPLVRQADRPAFEQAVRDRGIPDFVISEKDPTGRLVPAQARPEYFPVALIEPFAPNQAALGFDLGSDSLRMQTLAAARDSGIPAASPPVTLVQDAAAPGGPPASIILVRAVYQNGKPVDNPDERRASLLGFGLVVFHVKDLLSDALASASRQDLEIYLYDVNDANQPHFLAFFPSLSGPQRLPANPPRPINLYTSGAQSNTLTVGGRTWLMIVRPGAGYAAGKSGSVSWVVLGIGLLLAVLFLGYENTRMNAETVLAQSEARYRLISENSSDIIWIRDLEGRAFTYVSPSVERVLGYTPADFQQMPLEASIGPAWVQAVEESIPQRAAAYRQNPAQCAFTDELEQVRKDGSILHVEISTNYVTGENGNVQIVGITRDINERRQAQVALQESLGKLNAALASMTDAIVIVDRAGQITHTNAAYVTYHRFSSMEEFSRTHDQVPNLIEVFQDGGVPLPLEQRPVQRALRGESGVNEEYSLRRTDTGQTWKRVLQLRADPGRLRRGQRGRGRGSRRDGNEACRPAPGNGLPHRRSRPGRRIARGVFRANPRRTFTGDVRRRILHRPV